MIATSILFTIALIIYALLIRKINKQLNELKQSLQTSQLKNKLLKEELEKKRNVEVINHEFVMRLAYSHEL